MGTLEQFNCGGGKRVRTADPLHAMQVLYQLSYTPEREGALYRAKKENARAFKKKLIPDFSKPGINSSSRDD